MLTVLSCIFIVVKQIFANSKENVGKFKNYKSPLHLLLSSISNLEPAFCLPEDPDARGSHAWPGFPTKKKQSQWRQRILTCLIPSFLSFIPSNCWAPLTHRKVFMENRKPPGNSHILFLGSSLGKKSKSPVLLSFVRDFEVWLMNLSMPVRTVSISWQQESSAFGDHSVYVHCKQQKWTLANLSKKEIVDF